MTELMQVEFEIRQLYARFVDAAFRQDGQQYASLFVEEGEWKIGGMHMHGREEIGATFAKLLGYTAKVQLIAGTPLLEVNGDTAQGRVHCTELTKMPDGSSSMAIGVYHDTYTKEGGRWLFKKRHFSLSYRGPMDFSDDLVPSPEYGQFPGAPGPDEPTLTKLKPEQQN